MTIEQRSVLARDQAIFVEAQSTLDTMVAATTNGAIKVLKSAISYEQERIDRMDNRVTAGLVSRISGKRKIEITLDSYLIPSGSAGTAPDDQELWQALLGSETVSGGVSVTYAPDSTQAKQLVSLHRAHGVSTNCQLLESVIGAAVAKLKLSIQGSDPAKIQWSLIGRRLVTTGPGTLNGAMSSSTSMIVATNDANAYEVDSIVQVGATTGNRITAKSGATCTLTSAATASDGATVLPWAPTETTSGQPVAGIDGSLTMATVGGSAAVYVLGAEIEIDAGIKPYDDEYGAVHVTDFGVGWRKVSGSLTFRVRRDQIRRILAAKNDSFTARSVVLVCGGTAGSTVTITMSRCELSFRGIEFPENGDEATVQVPFVALASANNADDEISVVFT